MCGSRRPWGWTAPRSCGCAEGPDAPGWSPGDASLLRAADELHADARISDATWAELADDYDERGLIEIAILVGHYHLVAFALNSLEVELDPALEGLPYLPVCAA